MTLSEVTNKVLVDWNGDGLFSHALSNITNYVKSTSIKLGRSTETQLVATVGRCSIVLDNSSRLFSPLYSTGGLYGKLLPRRKVKVYARYNGVDYPIFTGWIDSISPDAGIRLKRECEIECVDMLAILQGHNLNMPVLRNVRADTAIKHVLNTVFGMTRATGSVAYAANPSAGATITVNGTVYTYRASVSSTPNEVLIGASLAATLDNLKRAVNGEGSTTAVYGPNTTQPAYIQASYGGTGGTIAFTYQLAGTVGNSATLSASVGTVVAFSGGTDLTGVVLDTGSVVFDYVGDKWGNERTNALRAIQDIVASEYGTFEIGKDGVARFHCRDYIFGQASKAIDLAAGYNMLPSGSMDVSGIKNRVIISMTPRGSLASGVLAKSDDAIAVPGKSSRKVTLKFTDPVSGQSVAANSLILPLVPVTDWQAGELAPGDNGGAYNNYNSLKFEIVDKGTGADITITNSATGTLKIFGLQIRGAGITQYQEIKLVAEDSASQAAYQVRSMAINLPLSTDPNLGQSLADYLLSRHKDPRFEINSVAFGNRSTISGVVLQSLDLRSILTFSDDQTNVNGIKYEIIGINQSIGLGNEASLTFNLNIIGDDALIYGIYDAATSKWDTAKWTI